MSLTSDLVSAALGQICINRLWVDFFRVSVKRCKDKSLEEALVLSREVSRELWELDDADVLPLIHCVLALQMEATCSSSSFHKLEQVCSALQQLLRGSGCVQRNFMAT